MGGQLAGAAGRGPQPDDAFYTALRSSDLFNNTLVATRASGLTSYEEASLTKPVTAEVRWGHARVCSDCGCRAPRLPAWRGCGW